MPKSLLFSPEESANAGARTLAFVERYLEGVAERPVFPNIDRRALRDLRDAPLVGEGAPIEDLIEQLETVIVANSTHTAHPRFLPYVQPTPNGLSPYAEMIAAALNQNCNLWTLSPAANAVELAVLGWFADLFGFPKPVGGLVTSGGSAANLIALTAARDRALGDRARTQGLQGSGATLVIYASDEVHSSIDKAVSLLGIGTDNFRKLPSDGDFRLSLDALREAVARDRALGLRPFCVVASAGTVTTGAFDPVAELAAFCRSEGLWLHVDGAYGALSALSDRFKDDLSGLGEADSLSLDPHKFLFTSFEAGCVLVKDRADLRRSFKAKPSYLDMTEDPDFVDFADLGPQLSRGFKALKVWWSLRHYGRRAYGETIDRMMGLAEQMAGIASARREFDLLAPVTFNCVCFKVVDLDDAGNDEVLQSLRDDGLAFLGPALVKGRKGMRACFMNLRTTHEDVTLIMNEIATRAAVLRGC